MEIPTVMAMAQLLAKSYQVIEQHGEPELADRVQKTLIDCEILLGYKLIHPEVPCRSQKRKPVRSV